MGSIRSRNGKLFFDFTYQGVRCREQSLLSDTKLNRAQMERILKDIEAEILLGRFSYREYFPNSKRLTKFTAYDTTAEEKKADMENTQLIHDLPTFAVFTDEWLSENTVRWKTSYINKIKFSLETHILPVFGNRVIDTISRSDILKFRAKLASCDNGQNRSNDYINHVMVPLRNVLEEAAMRFDIDCQYKNIKSLPITKKDIEPLSFSEVQYFISNVRSDFKNYYTIRFFTALRTAEIDGLQWRYIDFDNREILVRETFVKQKIETPKNTYSYREVKMSQPVYDALKKQFEITGSTSRFVFCNSKGNPLDQHNVANRIWYPTLKRLGMKKRRPYQTRHTTATLWLAAGESPEWIAKQMGHGTTKMLFEVYSRYVPNNTRNDGSAFDKLLDNFQG